MSYLDRREEPDFVAGVAKIALGLFAGALLCWMALHLYVRYQMRQLQAVVETSVQGFQQQVDRSMEQQRQIQEQRRRDQEAAKRVELEHQQALYMKRQEALAAERRKEAAWAEFFQPSAKCLATTSVECGNAHIRARKEFERRYAAGEL